MNKCRSGYTLIPVILFLFLLQVHNSLAQQAFSPPKNKVLVVSGGGARGAWGVGVVSVLYQMNGGYRAVFGTSTGSLMAPFIILQKFDELEQIYGNISQSDIFNQNPFKLTCDCTNFTASTKIRGFKAVVRFIFGKKTFGESKNLLKLIHQKLTQDDYNLLIDYYHAYQAMFAVAVTNTRTGNVEIKTDTGYTKSRDDYDRLCRWIWASANEPIFMSYVRMDSSYYVDGGVREVIPIQDALQYAISNSQIDSVEVIVNNSRIPGTQQWDVHGGGILYGLERLLDIYNMGTVAYNEQYAELLAKYYDATNHDPVSNVPGTVLPLRKIHLRIHYMPDSVAEKYPDALGFCKCSMMELIRQGKIYANTNGPCIDMDLDTRTIRAFTTKN
jgi:NTE family protein